MLIAHRMMINGKTYLKQKVPSLFTAMTAPQNLKQNPTIYGENSNSFAIKFGETVEIVINNQTPTGHPWHLHGHNFQVVARGGPGSQGTYDPKNADPLPMKRDVAGVPSTGFVVFRFKADNPGIQLSKSHPLISATCSLIYPSSLPHRMARRSRPHSHDPRSNRQDQ